MGNVSAEQLYQLLPAIYRLRDGEQGYPLRALIEVFAGQAERLEADIARLYENWFIETCAEWAIPYLGDLLGVRGLLPPERAGWSQRALVANTLRYRRRKGTVPLLELLVHDVTGWAARAVEFFNSVGTTQHLDHLRPGLGGTADLRQLRDSTLVGSAFDPLAYSPDIRLMSGTRPAPLLEGERPVGRSTRQMAGVGQGRPNLPNIGLYIWRLQPHRLERATAHSHGDGQRFRFNPLGADMPLFNSPDGSRDDSNVAEEHELPAALRTEALAEELEARCRALKEDRDPESRFFGERPAFQVYLPGAGRPVDFKHVLVHDLNDWNNPNILDQLLKKKSYRPEGDGHAEVPYAVVVDPELGRIFLPRKPRKAPDGALRVTYAYAFSDAVGGGPYDRRRTADDEADTVANPWALGTLIVIPADDQQPEIPRPPNHADSSRFISISAGETWPLKAALGEWSNRFNRSPAVIQIAGNTTHCMPENRRKRPGPGGKTPPNPYVQDIDLQGSHLVLQAANRCRPVLAGDLIVKGGSPTAQLTLSGLFIAGRIHILGALGRLTLLDCTLAPGITVKSQGVLYSPKIPSVTCEGDPLTALRVEIRHSIVGPVFLASSVGSLTVSDSVLDAPVPDAPGSQPAGSIPPTKANPVFPRPPGPTLPLGGVVVRPIVERGQLPAIAADGRGGPGPRARLERATVFGKVHVREMLWAEDVLFTAPVTADRTDIGLLRHCCVPSKSSTPRRENCQPDGPEMWPSFTARGYGEPGYAQLSLACPPEIRAGGTQGAEIGVFHNLRQPQREAALLAQLEEYLRFGLEAGLIYVN